MTETTKKRSTWTQGMVADLATAFHSGGLAGARTNMECHHKVPHAATDAKLAELKMLALSEDTIAEVHRFAVWLKTLDATSRGLALKRLRAEMKEVAG